MSSWEMVKGMGFLKNGFSKGLKGLQKPLKSIWVGLGGDREIYDDGVMVGADGGAALEVVDGNFGGDEGVVNGDAQRTQRGGPGGLDAKTQTAVFQPRLLRQHPEDGRPRRGVHIPQQQQRLRLGW